LLGHRLGMGLEPVAQALGKPAIVLVQHAQRTDERSHCLGITDRTLRSAENHPVKPFQYTHDIRFMRCYKLVHGVVLLRSDWIDTQSLYRRGNALSLGCGFAALCLRGSITLNTVSQDRHGTPAGT